MLDFLQTSKTDFESRAIELFRFQAKNCLVYKDYISNLKTKIENVKTIQEIPFLPIQFFKTHQVITKNKRAKKIFFSSGTSLEKRSQHFVADLSLYEKSFVKSFEFFYGKLSEYCIQALLPSYIENGDSSLIYMVEYFIKKSKNRLSGFVTEKKILENIDLLKNQKVLLIGVSYALLDLAERHKLDLSNYTIMETGGMKGRRKEWTRFELHNVFKNQFNVNQIHSEYGMTEMLSQAYSENKGIFKTAPWLKILTRPINEPFSNQQNGETGLLKIIDLANIYSCAFIETADIGKVYTDGSFEVLGRVDFETIRGCNLLIV